MNILFMEVSNLKMTNNRKTAYDIRHDMTIENCSLWVSASDYFDALIEIQELKDALWERYRRKDSRCSCDTAHDVMKSSLR